MVVIGGRFTVKPERRADMVSLAASAWQAKPSAPVASEPAQKPLSYYGKTSAGIPGAHNADHFGVVVSNLDDALRFCTTVLGADLLWTAGPFQDPVNNPSRYDVD